MPVFSYKLRYIVGFGLVEMAISTNPKPTIYEAYDISKLEPVCSYKLRYIVDFGLVEMAISTNPKPTIYEAYDISKLEPVCSYKLRYIVGFGLVEMAISTNPKPTIYRNLYKNTAPGKWPVDHQAGYPANTSYLPMLVESWPRIADGGLTLIQHWWNVSC